MLVQCERDEVCLSEALADPGHLDGGRIRGVQVTRLLPHHHGHEQVARLGAVAPLLVDQALRAAQPAGRAALLSADQQRRTQPDRAAGGTQRVAVAAEGLVRALEQGQVLVVATEHRGRRRQQLEVARS